MARVGNNNIADRLAHFRARSTSLGACLCVSDEDNVCELAECHWKIRECPAAQGSDQCTR
jgi:hypothetical protein